MDRIGARKKQIARIAVRLFKKDGYANVSVKDIVKAADTSLGSFYSYFYGKEEPVIMYRSEVLGRCLVYYRQLPPGDELAALEELAAKVLSLLELVGEEFGRVYSLRRIKEFDPALEDKPYLTPLSQLILSGQRTGSIRSDLEQRQMVGIVDSFIQGACLRWQFHRGGYSLSERSAQPLRQLCRQLSPAAAAAPAPAPMLSEAWRSLEAIEASLTEDRRSDIKQLENLWLESMTKN